MLNDIVYSTTFLGIDKHCSCVCSKQDSHVFVLNKIRQLATPDATLWAYHGYVSSVLHYGIVIWGNLVDIVLTIAQKKCVRAISDAD